MLIIYDNGKVEYNARGVLVEIIPANVLTIAERNTIRLLVNKLRAAGRITAKEILNNTILDIDNTVDP